VNNLIIETNSSGELFESRQIDRKEEKKNREKNNEEK
jgi:hypothetical protein